MNTDTITPEELRKTIRQARDLARLKRIEAGEVALSIRNLEDTIYECERKLQSMGEDTGRTMRPEESMHIKKEFRFNHREKTQV